MRQKKAGSNKDSSRKVAPQHNGSIRAARRLCGRYRRLSAAGNKLPVVIAAVARESAAFLWAVGRQVQPA
jgi:hypothetical protein